jgi:CheY-like chemotaxis protein
MEQSPPSVLLVEDNPAHAELIRRSFEQYEAAGEVVHLSDGEQALHYLFQRGTYAGHRSRPRPHVILLDLRLPRVDGLDVLQRIKTAEDEALRRIPVVVLTTSSSDRDLTEAYERHANSYIIKPMGFNGFTALMKQLGMYWFERNFSPWVPSMV